MPSRTQKPQFSPSLVHNRLMARIKPELSFSGGDVSPWQRKLRRKLKDLLGMPTEKVPLRVKRIWKREHPLGTIERILFRSEPCSDVPAYLCLPKGIQPPYPFFICLQGHSTGMHNSIGVDQQNERKTIKVEGDRDFGLSAMARGIGALCIEQRSLGERKEKVQKMIAPRNCWDASMHALMLGRTLIGERVWDVDRGIDYLLSRGDVDPRRIGVMGNSGGGTISVFSAAVLPRLKFAMPSCYFCTFRDSIMSIKHCMDNYVPHLLRYAEMSDVMGLFAPRPVVVVAGKTDPIFPIAAVRKSFRQLKRIYRAAGFADRCQLVVGRQGHRFYSDQAWPKMIKQMN